MVLFAALAAATPGALLLAALLATAGLALVARHTQAVFALVAAWLHRRLIQLHRKPGEDGSGSVLRVTTQQNGEVGPISSLLCCFVQCSNNGAPTRHAAAH
jgi:hypothetical protein